MSVLQGSRMKNSTPTPDLLSDSYPLDNNSVTTDLLDHPSRPRTDSSLFNQLISRIPASSDHTFQPASFLRNTSQQPWSEVNGDWRHQRNPLNIGDTGTREEPIWFDSDQLDVPLLSNTVVTKII